MLADIRKMLADLEVGSADFSADVPDAYGRPQPGFALPKDLTLTLVAGYNVKLRKRIIETLAERGIMILPQIEEMSNPGGGKPLRYSPSSFIGENPCPISQSCTMRRIASERVGISGSPRR